MPPTGEEPVCPKFQPNIFDPSRCHDCLRQRRLHSGGEATQKSTTEAVTRQEKGVLLTPISSQTEDREESSKEDWDEASQVSSCCVDGGEEGSRLCILSPECELYIYDDVQSTDSGRDNSDFQDCSGSVSTEDDYLPARRRCRNVSMTRLDPPPHRPNPRAWMEEARNKDDFTRRPGFKEDRGHRESGYFSLGRVAGARSVRESSDFTPYRHLERGHPLFRTTNVEPKDTVPFRNPNLGVASERQISEVSKEDIPLEIPPPDPYEIAVEVEAQVGPRSPSPTPFKIAESLASNSRKGLSGSRIKTNAPSHTSFTQSGRFDSSRQGSALQSRSSSPARSTSPFRRSEFPSSLNRTSFEGGRAAQIKESRARSSSQDPQGRRLDSGTLPRNFKAFAGSVKSQTSSVSDFRSALKKSEGRGSLNGRGRDSRSSTTADLYDHRTQSNTLSRGQNGRTCSPTRGNTENLRDSCVTSPPRRTYSSQSLFHKSESVTSLNGRSHHGRCGSPIREGYDIESQALLRNARNRLGDETDEAAISHTGRVIETQNRSILRKTQSSDVVGSRGRECPSSSLGRRNFEASGKTDLGGPVSRNSSPTRRSYEAPTQSMLQKSSSVGGRNFEASRKTDFGGSVSRNSSPTQRRSYEAPTQSMLQKSSSVGGRNFEASRKTDFGGSVSRNSSPTRRSYEAPTQSTLLKWEGNSSVSSRGEYGSLPSRRGHSSLDRSSPVKTENSYSPTRKAHNSRHTSPSRKGSVDPPGYSVLRNATNGEANSFQRRNNYNDSKSDENKTRSWRQSTSSLRSSSLSRAASPSRQTHNSRADSVAAATSQSSAHTRSLGVRPGRQGGCQFPNDNHSTQRPSSPPLIYIGRFTSSQSSLDSLESGQMSAVSTGRTREEYAVLADVPKVKIIHQREEHNHGRSQNHSTPRRQELFKPASHSLTKLPSRDWDEAGDTERDWHYAGSGFLSRAQSTTSLQRSGSPSAEEGCRGRPLTAQQPDLLNFKKGWMSKQDESGEWKKHWFVLTDAGLKYYRDSSAEEKDDIDGEIDLKSCVKVSEFDVEKNYGFQIQTREAVFTLSAMTAGIRRNWIEVLKKSIRPSSSPDLTQLPDSSSDKENSHNRFQLSSRRPSSRHGDAQPEVPTHRRFDYVELSPVPAHTVAVREAGEGQGREERSRDSTSSQWEAVLSRKPTGNNQRHHVEAEIEQKWAEFERLPLKEMSSIPSVASRPSADEALQREVASLRQQLEQLQQGGREGRGRGGCGPEAFCGRSLAAVERAHRQALEEMQRQHERQVTELQTEKERLLLQEAQDTAQVMEALKRKHQEELEREVERAKRLGSGLIDTHTLTSQQQTETWALQRELSGLSERYSQKCLDLNRAEQDSAQREREISRKERDLELLRKENQDLKTRLKEEIGRKHLDLSPESNRDGRTCELEVLLRMKESEIEYLHNEISCLRNELQFLNTEKRLACERYAEVREELSGIKGRNEREIQSLKEHLRLTMEALQEGQRLGNSLDH